MKYSNICSFCSKEDDENIYENNFYKIKSKKEINAFSSKLNPTILNQGGQNEYIHKNKVILFKDNSKIKMSDNHLIDEDKDEKSIISRYSSLVSLNKNKENNNNLNNENESNCSGIDIMREVQVVAYHNNEFYLGEVIIKNQLKDGYGIYETSTFVFKGEFLFDQLNGYGILKQKLREEIYEGEFINGNKSGIGVNKILYDNQSYHIGLYIKNKKNGIGFEKYKNGDFYEGEFIDDAKTGWGIYIYNQNNKYKSYKGLFKNNEYEGYGCLIYTNNDMYDGYWENSVYNGFGLLVKKKSIFKGYFKQGKKFGFGAKFKENEQTAMVGKWICDILEGYSILVNTTSNKVMKIYFFENGCCIKSHIFDEKNEILSEIEEYYRMLKFYYQVIR